MLQTDNPNNAIRILAADDEESFLELYQAVLESDEDEDFGTMKVTSVP